MTFAPTRILSIKSFVLLKKINNNKESARYKSLFLDKKNFNVGHFLG